MTEVTYEGMEAFAATSVPRMVRFRAMVWSQRRPSYDEFVETVDMAVSYSCNEMARNPQLVQGHSEDQLTLRIVSGLDHLGLDARFDSTTGGHCDVTVQFGDYLWLAEAKINTDTGWLWKGFQQLTTRYSTGEPGGSHGGMLIYCFNARTDKQMEIWRERLTKEDSGIRLEDESKYVAAAFRSRSISDRTGVELNVLHVPVSLLFEPRDRPKGKAPTVPA